MITAAAFRYIPYYTVFLCGIYMVLIIVVAVDMSLNHFLVIRCHSIYLFYYINPR